MLKSTYLKFKEKYEKEASSGLLFISYNNFTGDWEKDKRTFIRMINKNRKLFGNSKLGECNGCGVVLGVSNFGGRVNNGMNLCAECYEDYHHAYIDD